MNRRSFMMVTGLGGLAASGLWLHRKSGLKADTETTYALGTEVSITALHSSVPVAKAAIAAAFSDLHKIENKLSIYRHDSDVSTLNRNGKLESAHAHTLNVLRTSQQMAERSNGGFDVTVQPLWDAFSTAQKQKRLPTDEEVSSARAKVSWRDIEIDGSRIAFRKAGMKLTLNGIAQGYATDCLIKILREGGVENAIVNAGEIASLGRKADNSAWRVGVQHPRDTDAFIQLCALDGRCLATSGDYATTFSPDFANNHIFDPGTGHSPAHFSSVSIVAPSGMDADALSTAVFVLGVERGLELIRETPNCDALLVLKDGRVIETPNFPKARA